MNNTNISRSWEYWSDIIDEFNNSNLTITEFCKLNNVDRRTFYSWRKKLGTNKEQKKVSEDNLSFVPVSVISNKEVNNSLVVKVNDVYINVDASTDPDLLRKVVEVLK